MTGQVIWLTGLSGAGKTTVAKHLTLRIRELGLKPILLDGDILRSLFKNMEVISETYNREARTKLALKYAHLCKILSSQGFTVIIATVSMFREVYAWNRANLPNYFEVYLKVPLDELRLRDPKKIYQRYDAGELNNVAGLDLCIDEPLEPHVTLDFEIQPFLWKSPGIIVEHLIFELENLCCIVQPERKC
jgi:cytidine diphosphoramidate kinase